MIHYETEILFPWSTDTSIHIEIERMSAVSVINNIFVSKQLE